MREKRYQHCDPVTKLWRNRWFLLYPYYYWKYSGVPTKFIHQVAVTEIHFKMKYTFTIKEIKAKWAQENASE